MKTRQHIVITCHQRVPDYPVYLPLSKRTVKNIAIFVQVRYFVLVIESSCKTRTRIFDLTLYDSKLNISKFFKHLFIFVMKGAAYPGVEILERVELAAQVNN